MGRDRLSRLSLGTGHHAVKSSRTLLVGAGGIGCELLKNMVMMGFGEIHVVDLDTIDLSNLNRQFLFGHEHIKRSKALVAKESAQHFNPNVTIEAHHANIKDPQFNLDWYSSFALVFNALDNLDARRHVNRMCMAADVPLIESGTTGFNGQTQVIKKGQTKCYDCNDREPPKSFPVCTIRSTPSQPIHCIVWAKSYLFAEVFGTSEDASSDLDTTESSENAEEIENLKREAQALKRIRDSMGSEEFPRKVFEKVYTEDIERLKSMEDMWKTRTPPEPLDFDKLTQEALGVGSEIGSQDQALWTPAENFSVFCTSLQKLSTRLEETRAQATAENAPPVMTFDKDDKDMLDFVAAAANLRSKAFDIECKSEFDIKQMAGNIIPAIATTNAMAAGLCVLQAFKVLKQDWQKARMVYITQPVPERGLSSQKLEAPKPDCPVCCSAQVKIQVDFRRATLEDLVEKTLKTQLGYGTEFSISTETGLIFDPELDDNLPKKLSELSVDKDSFLTVIDEADEDPRINLVLSLTEQELPEDAGPVVLPEQIDVPRKSKPTTPVGETNGFGPESALLPTSETNGVGGKRKRPVDEADVEAENVRKRGKVFEEPGKALEDRSKSMPTDGDEDGVMIVGAGGDGAIVID